MLPYLLRPFSYAIPLTYGADVLHGGQSVWRGSRNYGTEGYTFESCGVYFLKLNQISTYNRSSLATDAFWLAADCNLASHITRLGRIDLTHFTVAD